MKRRAVSPVIAELLLIVITVAIGTLVYSFASTAFGGFGAGFSNVVAGAGQTIAENVVIEQGYFYANSTGGTLYILNAGQNVVTVETIFMTNATSSSEVSTVGFEFLNHTAIFSGAFKSMNIAPGTSQQIVFCYTNALNPTCTNPLSVGLNSGSNFSDAYAFTIVTARGNQFIAYEKP